MVVCLQNGHFMATLKEKLFHIKELLCYFVNNPILKQHSCLYIFTKTINLSSLRKFWDTLK